jgi:hypothetical protein
VRGHDIHRLTGHDRRRFVTPQDAGRECEGRLQPGHIGGRDLIEAAVAGAGKVLGWNAPLTIVWSGWRGHSGILGSARPFRSGVGR